MQNDLEREIAATEGKLEGVDLQLSVEEVVLENLQFELDCLDEDDNVMSIMSEEE